MMHARDDVKKVLQHLVPARYRGIHRALDLERWEFLGGFEAVPPSGWDGYLARITSIHGRIWIVAVLYRPGRFCPTARLLSVVPWDRWVGDKYPDSSLSRGDRPDYYHAQKMDMAKKHPGLHPGVDRQSGSGPDRPKLVLQGPDCQEW